MRRHGFTLVLMLVAVASSGGAQQAAAPPVTCEPAKFNKAWTAQAPVYRSCEVEREATLIGTAPALNWNPSGPVRGCSVAVLEFVVDTLGVPEERGARVVRTTATSLAGAVLRSIPGRRYTVATKDGHGVRQVIRDSIAVSAVGGSLVGSETMMVGPLAADSTSISRIPARRPESRCKP